MQTSRRGNGQPSKGQETPSQREAGHRTIEGCILRSCDAPRLGLDLIWRVLVASSAYTEQLTAPSCTERPGGVGIMDSRTPSFMVML